MSQPLTWYLRRLRAMSPGEILHRAGQVARKRAWRRALRSGAIWPAPQPTLPSAPVEVWPHVGAPTQLPELIAEAESALAHRWRFFGQDLHEPIIDWHADPASGISAPRTLGCDIDHRDEHLVGNIKITWEKSRHHHLSVLAAAYRFTGDERYAAEVADQILSWVAQNPVMVGVNWTHPLEQGIRLIAWVWCERLLRGSPHHARAFSAHSPVWASIWQHQRFIAVTYSRGSSANNHLIGEMAGLYVASAAWPWWPQSEGWCQLAKRILEREAVAQTYPSGINRELAFGYQIFVTEFYLLALHEAGRIGDGFAEGCRDIVRRMIEAIPALADCAGNLPRYGDADEGLAIQLQALDPAARLGWIFQVGHALVAAQVATDSATPTAAILGHATSTSSSPLPHDGAQAFPDAGLYLLASRRRTPHEVLVLADAGPLGFLGIAAHGHADALSFTLHVGGIPILVDPGTYAYHTEPKWRSYFRSTAAHNTVVVNGRDQSLQQGSFLWSRKAAVQVHDWRSDDRSCQLDAEHDGYEADGVRHRRRWTLTGNRLEVADRLVGTGSHRVAMHLHCHPDCSVERVGDRLMIAHGAVRAAVQFPLGFAIEVVTAGEDAGWYSPCFGQRVSAPTIRATGSVSANQQWITQLELYP